jgi:hypothetical protein
MKLKQKNIISSRWRSLTHDVDPEIFALSARHFKIKSSFFELLRPAVIGLKWIPIRIRTGNTEDPEAIKVIKLAKIGPFVFVTITDP